MNEPTKKPHGVGYWCCWAVLALVLYVGSAGPALVLLADVGATEQTVEVVLRIYGPAERIIRAMPPETGVPDYYDKCVDQAMLHERPTWSARYLP